MISIKGLLIGVASASLCMADISGIVIKDTVGAIPVAGASVQLEKTGLTAITGADGRFTIVTTGTLPDKHIFSSLTTFSAALHRGAMWLHAAEPHTCVITVFDLKGKALFTVRKAVDAGASLIDLPRMGVGVFLYKVKAGPYECVLKGAATNALSYGKAVWTQWSVVQYGSFKSAIMTAVIADTLRVKKNGYLDCRITVNNSDTSAIVIKLTPYQISDTGIEQFRPPKSAKAYYIDAHNGSDNADGLSPATAWLSLTKLDAQKIKPGEVIRLARGSVWNTRLNVVDSGTASSPITIEAYGSGKAPTIDHSGIPVSNSPIGLYIKGSNIVVLDIHLRNIAYIAVQVVSISNSVVIAGTEISNSGCGIAFAGKHHKALSNNIHDLRTITSTRGGYDDWGALAVLLEKGEDYEVAYNRFENCIDTCQDFLVDGGAVEFLDTVSRALIHHNWAYNVNGFSEMTGKNSGIIFSNNVYIGGSLDWNPVFIGMHMQTSTRSYDVRIENNTAVSTCTKDNYNGIISFWTSPNSSQDGSSVTLRNNVFVSATRIWLCERPLNLKFIHENNLYGFIGSGGLGFMIPSATEKTGDPRFLDLANRDVRLSNNSPAIDAGTHAINAFDLIGTKIHLGLAPDLGAYECR